MSVGSFPSAFTLDIFLSVTVSPGNFVLEIAPIGRSSVDAVWKIFLIILSTIPCHVILNFQQEAKLSGYLNIKSRASCVLLLANIYFPEYDVKRVAVGILVTSQEIFHFCEIFKRLVPSFTTLEAFSPVKTVFIETPCTGYFCCAFRSRR